MKDEETLSAPTRLRYDNRITLQKLEVFCSVVDLGGVTRAADQLWVAQSVVSGHLRSLQERLGVRLFYRDGQHLKLTKEGERVYRWATETLANTRELMRDLEDAGSGQLAIAASLAVGNYLLPPILAALRHDIPTAAISMSVSDPDETFDLIEKGQADLGIVIAETAHGHPQLQSEVLGHEEILLVAAPNSLVGIDAISVADLGSLALVAPAAGTLPREAVDRQLTELGAPPQNAVMELGHPEAMKRVIRSGLDACLLFRSCVEDDLEQGTLRQIHLIDARLSLPVWSVEHKERPRHPVQGNVVARTRAHLESRASTPST